jgi:hypothetical protein
MVNLKKIGISYGNKGCSQKIGSIYHKILGTSFLIFLTFLFYEGEKKYVNRKHCADPPRVPPIRHPKRVAVAENAHPQLCSLRHSQPFSIVVYAARIRVNAEITFLLFKERRWRPHDAAVGPPPAAGPDQETPPAAA